MTALIAASLLSLTACSGNHDSQNSSPEKHRKVSADQADPNVINRFNSMLALDPEAEDARQKYIATCVASGGGQWTPVPRQPERTVTDSIGTRKLTLQEARTRGYLRLPPAEAAAGEGADAKSMELFMGTPDSPKVTAEFLGMQGAIAGETCLAKSLKEIYGSTEDGMIVTGIVANALTPVVGEVLNDEEDHKIVQDWKDCMVKAGVKDFDSPGLAQHSARNSADGNPELAVKDVTCREEVKYYERRDKLIAQYLTPFYKAHEADFLRVEEIKKKGRENAPKVR